MKGCYEADPRPLALLQGSSPIPPPRIFVTIGRDGPG